MKNNPLTRTDIGRFEINGTGTEQAISVQRPFDIRSTSVQHPFSVRSFPVFSKRAPVERAVYGKFLLTHTVRVLHVFTCILSRVHVYMRIYIHTYMYIVSAYIALLPSGMLQKLSIKVCESLVPFK